MYKIYKKHTGEKYSYVIFKDNTFAEIPMKDIIGDTLERVMINISSLPYVENDDMLTELDFICDVKI